jgi:hypothetical protein
LAGGLLRGVVVSISSRLKLALTMSTSDVVGAITAHPLS